MSSIKDHLFDIQQEQADKWIRERLSDADAGEESEEYQSLAQDYSNYQEYLAEQAEFEAELEWLKNAGSSFQHQSFLKQLEQLDQFVRSANSDHEDMHAKMSFAYAVTLLETYLADAAKTLVSSSEYFFRNAIKNIDELKKAKYSLSSLASEPITPRGLAVKELAKVLYHNLSKVKRIIEGILDNAIDVELENLIKAVDKRHDIVHRNGQTKEGKHVLVTVEDCVDLTEEMRKFANSLQKQINTAEQGGAHQSTTAP